MIEQILFVSGNTLLLLQYSYSDNKLIYGIYDNITIGITDLWQGTCIVEGTEKDLNKLKKILNINE